MKITKFYNKKEKKDQYRARFQFNNEEFYPSADTRKELKEIIDEIRVQERRVKRGLETAPLPAPRLKEFYEFYIPKIKNEKHRKFTERVVDDLLEILPDGIKITEFSKQHFQKYINVREGEINAQSGEKIQPATINKEMYAARAPLKEAHLYYPGLEKYEPPKVPRIKVKRKRRERLVDVDAELKLVLGALRRERTGKQTDYHIAQRKRLADELEFRYQTGLRRKEAVRLEKKQYFAHDKSLRTVQRFKTETVSVFIPLSARAVELIESRLSTDSEYIFSESGEVKESDYRTLKNICAELEIPYGRYKSGGFVPHDLRHNFVTEIMQVTDIETARTLTGHTSNEILTYLHTNESRQREAVARREKRDSLSEIVDIYKSVKRGKMKLKSFVENLRKMSLNSHKSG